MHLSPDGPAINLAAFDGREQADTVALTQWAQWLRQFGVYFCSPLDLDYSMLRAFPAAYQIVEPGRQGPSPQGEPRDAVLGEQGLAALYDATHDEALRWYRYLFLGRGKPSTHVRVLSELSLEVIAAGVPEDLRALLTELQTRLTPEPAEADEA